jgi:hypothetical protein
MNNINYTVHIAENPEDDFLTQVDLRTLSEGRLLALRDEAGWAGDGEMVYMIGEVMGQRQYWDAGEFIEDYFPQADNHMLAHLSDMLEGRAASFKKMKAEPGTQEWLDEWAERTTATRQGYYQQWPTYTDIDDLRRWLRLELDDLEGDE